VAERGRGWRREAGGWRRVVAASEARGAADGAASGVSVRSAAGSRF